MPTLDWIGKQAVVNHHREVPYRLIHCDGALSAGDAEAGNLLVQGDNLQALRALLPYYAGRVKCIYIDPPYNTGNEKWTYNDNVNSPEIRRWLEETLKGQHVGKEGEDLSRHDKWLCMMYPRLWLLREFLREDGFIAISIDENELVHLLNICDEIFKRGNFRVVATRKAKSQSANDGGGFSYKADYVVVFSKSKNSLVRKVPPDPENTAKTHREPTKDFPLSRWQHVSIRVSSGHQGGGYEYKRKSPDGTTHSGPWLCPPETYDQLKAAGRLYFGSAGSSAGRRVMYDYEAEGAPPDNLWTEVGTNSAGKKELESIIGKGSFQTPKPSSLIRHILHVCNVEPNDLILDSFAGSGTTGHAVLDLNKQDGGNRQFILVEMDEDIAATVTAERLRRVITGYDKGGDKSKPVAGLGGGFRFCRLGVPLFDEYGDIAGEVTFPDLAAHIFFSEVGVPIPMRAQSELLGIHQGRAVYLLFDAAFAGAPREAAGNVLTPDRLANLPEPPKGFDGTRVVYAEGCTVSADRLRGAGVTFKQIPYQVEGV